mmetsp:Transcript_40723/g.65397  ORF Transcript_40723/g.65397 Transcript_40723/m.65397 type:complete len:999 (-) Transcript_40723:19-3015(-)
MELLATFGGTSEDAASCDPCEAVEDERKADNFQTEILRGPKLRDFTRLHPDANLNEIVLFRKQNQGEDAGAEAFVAGSLLDLGGPDKQVDFVARDVDIKKVFELSYAPETSTCSIFVQRVGDTLVLDGKLSGDLDLPELETEDPLTSKFLFYSVKEATPQEHDVSNPKERRLRGHGSMTGKKDTSKPLCVDQDPLDVGHSVSAPQGDTPFDRVVNWKVGNFNVVLGSNLLIVKDEEHRNVSLKLRDATLALTSKICLDYWLDNKINGADHTTVCIHKQGLVQGYQIIPTQALPSFADHGAAKQSFQPRAISHGACDILAFLKRHCTEDGATYCLRKVGGKRSDLCLFQVNITNRAESNTDEGSTFVHGLAGPVAGLYYRLAKKFYEEGEKDWKETTNLLRKAIDLLKPICVSGAVFRRAQVCNYGAILVLAEELASKVSILSDEAALRDPPAPFSNRLDPVVSYTGHEKGIMHLESALETLLRLCALQRQRVRIDPDSILSREENQDAEDCLYVVDGESYPVVERRLRGALFKAYLALALGILPTPDGVPRALQYITRASQTLGQPQSDENAIVVLYYAATAYLQLHFCNKSGHPVQVGTPKEEVTSPQWLLPCPTYMNDIIVLDVPSGDSEGVLNLVAQLLVRALGLVGRPGNLLTALPTANVTSFLFLAYRELCDVYVNTGRYTKAFAHINKGIQLFSKMNMHDSVLRLKLFQVDISFEMYCGVSLQDEDVITPLTIAAVVTDANSLGVKFGIETGSQKVCSFDPQTYVNGFESLRQLFEGDSELEPELRREVVSRFVVSCVRYGVVLCVVPGRPKAGGQRKADHELGLATLMYALDVCLTGNLARPIACIQFAVGVCIGNRLEFETDVDQRLQERLGKRALEYFEQARAGLYPTERILVRIEMAHVLDKMSGKTRIRKALDLLLDSALSEDEAGVLDGEDVLQWRSLKAIVQKLCLELLRISKTENLKTAYKLILSNPDNLTPSKVLASMKNILK